MSSEDLIITQEFRQLLETICILTDEHENQSKGCFKNLISDHLSTMLTKI